jgi:hypothetical protein
MFPIWIPGVVFEHTVGIRLFGRGPAKTAVVLMMLVGSALWLGIRIALERSQVSLVRPAEQSAYRYAERANQLREVEELAGRVSKKLRAWGRLERFWWPERWRGPGASREVLRGFAAHHRGTFHERPDFLLRWFEEHWAGRWQVVSAKGAITWQDRDPVLLALHSGRGWVRVVLFIARPGAPDRRITEADRDRADLAPWTITVCSGGVFVSRSQVDLDLADAEAAYTAAIEVLDHADALIAQSQEGS